MLSREPAAKDRPCAPNIRESCSAGGTAGLRSLGNKPEEAARHGAGAAGAELTVSSGGCPPGPKTPKPSPAGTGLTGTCRTDGKVTQSGQTSRLPISLNSHTGHCVKEGGHGITTNTRFLF